MKVKPVLADLRRPLQLSCQADVGNAASTTCTALSCSWQVGQAVHMQHLPALTPSNTCSELDLPNWLDEALQGGQVEAGP
eukprot:1087734-Alexandrium_andersonii.AAC.1